jgi:hypothetical protein
VYFSQSNESNQANSDADPRFVLRRIFRDPTCGHFPGFTWSPITPSRLWSAIVPCPGFSVHPSKDVLDRFPTTTHGRIIDTVPKHANREPHVLAMLSLRKEVTRVSPHPGVRPSELDQFIHPWYVTTDASLGPYNASRYAQSFDHRRPWMGFHKFTSSPVQIEDFCAVKFYNFNGVKEEGMLGGSWKQNMLDALFEARSLAEATLLDTLAKVGDANGEKLLAHFGPSLPFFDPLNPSDCDKWGSWREGRDALGYTLRYVNELIAMRRWLPELARQIANPGVAAAIDGGYSGTWVGTVTTSDDWQFLMDSPLPLFGLFAIPKNHPLYSRAVRGSLDNDEFYRTDPVVHYFHSIPTAYDKDYPTTSFHRPINCPMGISTVPGKLPSRLVVLPPGEAQVAPSPIDYHHPYTTYLFNDVKICRNEDRGVPSNRSKLLRKRVTKIADATMRPHFPPALEGAVTFARLPFHPMSAVLPPRSLHDTKQRRFLEENFSIFFWPTLISKKQFKYHNEYYHRRYLHDLGDNDLLESDWPWPCAGDVEPRREDDDGDVALQSLPYVVPYDPKRVYVRREPSDSVLDMLPLDIVMRPRHHPTSAPAVGKNVARPSSWQADDDDYMMEEDEEPGSGFATPLAHAPPTAALGATPMPDPSFSSVDFITACQRDLATDRTSGPRHKTGVSPSAMSLLDPGLLTLAPSVSTLYSIRFFILTTNRSRWFLSESLSPWLSRLHLGL